MTIHRDDGEYKCVCDDCGYEMPSDGMDDFEDFVEEVKAEGWRMYKDKGNDWVHICPTCAEGT
jgi:hypothetical protein